MHSGGSSYIKHVKVTLIEITQVDPVTQDIIMHTVVPQQCTIIMEQLILSMGNLYWMQQDIQ